MGLGSLALEPSSLSPQALTLCTAFCPVSVMRIERNRADNEKKIQMSVLSHVLPLLLPPALLPPRSPEKLNIPSDFLPHTSRPSPLGVIFKNVVLYLGSLLKRKTSPGVGFDFLICEASRVSLGAKCDELNISISFWL